MTGAGRTVVQPSILGGGPVGDPFPSRNVDPGARQYLSQYGYLRGAGALLASVPMIGLPNAGSLGPDWSAAGPSPVPPTDTPPAAADDGCCG